MNGDKSVKKVIVSGATGQDGSYMVEYLLANTPHTVLAGVRRTSQPILSNLSACLSNPRLKLVPLDLTDVHSIASLIKNEKPDYFINLGGATFVADSWNSPALTMRTNTESLVHICEGVRHYVPHCRLYSAGSSEQWGNVVYSPQDINHPMRPRSVYGVSKCAAGLICKVYRESFGLFAIHGILTNHESERRQEYFVSRKITKGVAKIVRALAKKQELVPIELGNISAERDWSHAEDFVDGIWKMLNQEKPKEYVLSSGEIHSVSEFVERSFGEAGIKGEWLKGTKAEDLVYSITAFGGNPIDRFYAVKINPKFYRPAEVEKLLGDSTPARLELGWSPKVSFQELVKRMTKHDILNES